jgi:hypothetical protein
MSMLTHMTGSVLVILRRVRVTIVAMEKRQLLHILSVFVALVIQHAKRMRRDVICGLSGSAIFFHIMSEKLSFGR